MDDLRRIDLNLLLALHALLAEKHVTRAALRLSRSQPAVSHALAQLRDIFQDPLLIRRGPGMVLTPRAQELLHPLDAALNQLNALLGTPGFDPAQARRRFRLAMSDYAAHLILPSLTQQLRSQAPGITLAISQISRDAVQIQLIDGEVDLALGVFPDAPNEIQLETLFDENFVSVADTHSLPARGGLSLSDWLARPHVLVATETGADNEIDAALAARGLRRHVALVLPHWGASARILTGTDLLLTVARRSLEGMPRDNSLRAFPPPLPLPGFAFQQAWHERRTNDAAHRWLRHLLHSCGQPKQS
ncbi:LysR family transcriptional regulator [Bordetella avium]|uniref:LysR-family transcriptional regulator n=1 Tax=Bordetella avium (strain 197N) TaxID=360910 RepID=Q2KZ98_BORA1|nr:LysR family transcriptional regulator [Bordetella avium]AZY49441.1 LysR family transcriptional regulator [Bordetella avium]AZY52796.1 LysR family transcriptional regulator [Bordetella avium]RIQ12137.1 LysR family transcriptional regulator [Bordetella avium]RIQ19043.1 LysR family transcriptional regulator [Bordetella avium]RIQ31952.1 LysR family transcriptional regulator [Bordetella avium]